MNKRPEATPCPSEASFIVSKSFLCKVLMTPIINQCSKDVGTVVK